MADIFLLCLALVGTRPSDLASQPFWDHFAEVSELLSSPGTSLLLFRLDANGDGRLEIFLAHSQKCGNGGCPWYVYSPTARPGRVKYLGEAGFAVGGYRFARGVLTYCWHMSAAECGWGQYRFRGDRMEQLPGRTCIWGSSGDTSWCDSELEAIRQWQAQAPRVFFTRLPDPDEKEPQGLVWTARDLKALGKADLPALDDLTVEVHAK